MSSAAAFAGTYSDLKLVKSRSVAQVVVEIPIEKAEGFIAAFGMPIPGAERPVALALLNLPTDKPEQPKAVPAGGEKTPEERMVIRAIMLCKDFRFQEWICGTNYPPNEDNATDLMRKKLNITTRAHIAKFASAQRQFLALETEFRQAHGMMAEQRG